MSEENGILEDWWDKMVSSMLLEEEKGRGQEVVVFHAPETGPVVISKGHFNMIDSCDYWEYKHVHVGETCLWCNNIFGIVMLMDFRLPESRPVHPKDEVLIDSTAFTVVNFSQSDMGGYSWDAVISTTS